jgi:hypothetical protein
MKLFRFTTTRGAICLPRESFQLHNAIRSDCQSRFPAGLYQIREDTTEPGKYGHKKAQRAQSKIGVGAQFIAPEI